MNEFIKDCQPVLLLGLIGTLIFIGSIWSLFYHIHETNKYCIEQSWTGGAGDRCYKDYPSNTGLGVERRYSGRIDKEVKEWLK